MPLPPNYVQAVELLGQVCLEDRRACGGDRAWLVGGASVVILTDGAFHSGDFDLVASNEAVFREILLKHGFQDEKGQGRAGSVLHVGWMHPNHPDLGWQLVTGPLFDGRSDKSRGIAIKLKPDSELTLPAGMGRPDCRPAEPVRGPGWEEPSRTGGTGPPAFPIGKRD